MVQAGAGQTTTSHSHSPPSITCSWDGFAQGDMGRYSSQPQPLSPTVTQLDAMMCTLLGRWHFPLDFNKSSSMQ